LVGATGHVAGAAVAFVDADIDTDVAAIGEPGLVGIANAGPLEANLVEPADDAAAPTVVVVVFDVDARPIAQRVAGAAATEATPAVVELAVAVAAAVLPHIEAQT